MRCACVATAPQQRQRKSSVIRFVSSSRKRSPVFLRFGFNLDQKRTTVLKTRDAFVAEFRTDLEFARELSEKLRPQRKALLSLLSASAAADPSSAEAIEILRLRSQRRAPAIAQLLVAEQAGRLSKPLADLAPSFLHMHANRLLRSAHRSQELVLHSFLKSLYQSQAALAATV